jgi:hypothetical protein
MFLGLKKLKEKPSFNFFAPCLTKKVFETFFCPSDFEIKCIFKAKSTKQFGWSEIFILIINT